VLQVPLPLQVGVDSIPFEQVGPPLQLTPLAV
jgi:hypothetical protein